MNIHTIHISEVTALAQWTYTSIVNVDVME